LNYTKESYLKAKNDFQKITKLQQYLIVCFMSLSLRRNEVSKAKRSDIKVDEKYIKIFGKGAKYKDIPIPE
jgi:site-specific recombinase XerC